MSEQQLTWYDLGVDIHTALRKYCGSPQTSAMYNMIHMEAFSSVWEAYLRNVVTKLNHDSLSMLDALCQAVDELQCNMPETTAMRCVFRCFDNDDWENIVQFISEAI